MSPGWLTGRRSAGRPPTEGTEVAAQRELFDTIKATYPVALEQEQHAMIRQLRSHLPTVSEAMRTTLIDDIERSIGQAVEEEADLGQ